MPAATTSHNRGSSAGPDDLDDLLDYDEAVQDFWKDMPEANGDNANESNNAPEKDMDEEVKVAKKRRPNPKLDQDRLLSSAGIPKLRRIAKDKLKFKGKGHEFSDISRMLNLYQLWLDDLYPKAKFKDGLAMVEKLGHTKRMQVSRRAWIDESKGFRRREDEDAEMRLGDITGQGEDNDEIFPIPSVSKESGLGQEQSGGGADAPDDDELDALMGEEPAAAAPPNITGNGPTKSQGPFEDDDDPDEDELDALLNEDLRPAVQSAQQATKPKGPFEDDEDDEDELDALLAEEPQQNQANGRATIDTGGPQPSKASRKDDDFADDEEAMAEMGW